MRLKTFFKLVFVVFFLCLAGLFSYRAGFLNGQQDIRKRPPIVIENPEGDLVGGEKPSQVDFAVFWEVWHRVEEKFLMQEDIDYRAMVYGAVNGMLESLGDPYTSFFTPEEAESFQDELKGKYEGVGMYVGVKDGQLTVISPLKGSPAEQAGLKPEDVIVKIEDTFTADLSTDEAIDLIKGPRGTEVKLLIQRKDWKEPKEFIVKRELIKIPTLDWELIDNKIALIKIYQFNQILISEFQKASLEVLNSSADSIIVDLRNNPGGYLEVAEIIASWFVPQGEVIVWQDRGEGEEREPFKSKGPAAFSSYHLVVLINEGSASGAEILAGALRDQLGARLVGEKSFGKGLVQEQISLFDGSSMKVTIAQWLTPNGSYINEQGLEPDIFVASDNGEEEEDIQLAKAIEILQNIK